MLSTVRKHLCFANVASALALVFSMSGAALAANHYLINSTKQISPKVLKKLKGNSGPTGSAGAAGTTGAAGATGKEGQVGPSHEYNNEAVGGFAKVTVPPGKYSIHAFGALRVGDASDPGFGYCELLIAGSLATVHFATVPSEGYSEEILPSVSETFGEVEIPNQTTATLNAGGVIEVQCGTAEHSLEPVGVENTSVEAIQVGAVN